MTLARWIGAHATALLAAALLVLPAPPAEAQPAAQAFFHTAAPAHVRCNHQPASISVTSGKEPNADLCAYQP